MTANTDLTFETAYARLEEILEKINSGRIALEDSLKLYEEANHLITWCSRRLSDAEKKIELLTKNREGDLKLDAQGRPELQPFSPTQQTVLR